MTHGDAEMPTATFEWSGPKRRHRVRFEKRPAGGWTRIKQSRGLNDEGWRTEGTEPVADVRATVAVAQEN